jgi:hypothetical protein
MEQALAQDAKQVIEEAIDEPNLSEIVRPDAKHFLLVNFHQFILTPAYLSSENLGIKGDQVLHSLRTDVRTILRASEELARQRETGEISGHIVLDSISNSWGVLKSTFYEFWDC